MSLKKKEAELKAVSVAALILRTCESSNGRRWARPDQFLCKKARAVMGADAQVLYYGHTSAIRLGRKSMSGTSPVVILS